MAMKDYELAKMSLAELLQPTLERMAEEEPEKLGKLLTPERLARALTPEQIAGALTPEQIVGALTPEQHAKALTPERLTEFLQALPPELREQIKRQLH
jgi:hypothetical protein